MPVKKLKNGGADHKAAFYVGIGASAGGLEAINELFESMPDNTGFSFIIIQHLSPDYKSLMAGLLSKHTVMPVVEAENGMPLRPNCVYLIPNKKFMTVSGGQLMLEEKKKGTFPNNAIDIFFESLAADACERAIAIILSGTGSDGTKGIKEVKKNGGLVIVQDPGTAQFDGMPNSAIATGVADLVVPAINIATELIEHLNESPLLKSFHANNQKAEFVLRDVLIRIRHETKLDFSHYKRPTLFRRLAKRMAELTITNTTDYLSYIDNHPHELDVLSKEFLINVSSFFRDSEAFEIMGSEVIPALIKEKARGENIKVWTVACSTGQEVYSLAILFREYLEQKKIADLTIKIFATDIDKDAIDFASRGQYSRSAVHDVPQDLLRKYFIEEGNNYRIDPEIRKMIVFSYHDIMKDPPFSRMDLVSCRNMLIYVNTESQAAVLKKLYFALHVGGYLFLGPSENIGEIKNSLHEIDKKWKIYRCGTKVKLADQDNMFVPMDATSISNSLPKYTALNALQHIGKVFTETIIEEHHYAGIFITPEFEVKQAMGNYKDFLEFPESGFDFNILKLVKTELSLAISIAVRKAIKNGSRVSVKNVRMQSGQGSESVSIIVKPYLQQKEYTQPFLFLVLQKETARVNAVKPAGINRDEHIAELERELNDTRGNLQALIEEVETSNEELQSTNEELISSNEELQSTNEELQSLNEELHTVSAEHQIKIRELTELNDDLNNYFRNSDIGQILIDRKLIIRKFTPSVTKMINLIATDINRPISDITNKIEGVDLLNDIRRVIKTGNNLEREITIGEQGIFLMRISPFIKQDGSPEGVVVSFIDLSEIKRLHHTLEAVFNSSSSIINVKKAIRDRAGSIIDFEYIAANTAQ